MSSWGGVTALRDEEWKHPVAKPEPRWPLETCSADLSRQLKGGFQIWQLHGEGSSNCFLLHLGHFPAELFITFRVQEKFSVESKTDGKMFNSKHNLVPGGSPNAVLRGLFQVVASAGSSGCCRKRSYTGYKRFSVDWARGAGKGKVGWFICLMLK